MPRRKVQTSTVSAPKPIKATALGALPTPEALKALFKDLPNIELLSRRFTNPNLPGSLPILLKDEDIHSCTNSEHLNRLKPGSAECHLCGKPARKWYIRWFNLGKENRAAEMRALQYEGVLVTELQDSDAIADLYRSKEDHYVRRGDHGKELLAKMPLVIYNYIKAKQREQWNANVMKPKKVRESVANLANDDESLGNARDRNEAANRIGDGEIMFESFKRSKTTLGDEAGVEVE